MREGIRLKNRFYRQIHLDFHTPELPFQLAKDFSKNEFQETLKNGHVSSITLTARDHHGHIYYDSKFPAQHPQMVGDFLMSEVDACHEIGINCPLYLTVGWDAYSAKNHPEWLERKKDGSLYGFDNVGQIGPGWKTLCFNTKYTQYLFDQTVETMEHFKGKLDGLFFDIIRQDPCYCDKCIQKMIEQGFDPENIEDVERFADKTKVQFKKEMTALIHNLEPECPIFYNEGNITPAIRKNLSDYDHLEIESLASGDWGYQHFPVVVRYAKNLEKPYIGMTGKFQRNWADFGSLKNKAALEYECFLPIAHGAGCSIGDQMYPEGKLQKATYKEIGEIYQKIESIEPYITNIHACADIAVMHTDLYRKSAQKVNDSLAGAVNLLNEKHLQFDIIDDQMDFNKYRLIILPDTIFLKADLERKLENYVSNGGKLLLTYKSGLIDKKEQFSKFLNIRYIGNAKYKPTYAKFNELYGNYLSKAEIVLHGDSLAVKSSMNKIGELWNPMYNRSYLHYYSHYQAPIYDESDYILGAYNQQIVYLAHDYFKMYRDYGVREYKEIIYNAITKLLNYNLQVDTDAPSTADVILNKANEINQYQLNYLNYVPVRKTNHVDIIEEATPVYNTKFKLANMPQIKNVKSLITGKRLKFEQHNDQVEFVLDELNGFELLGINF